MPMPSSPSSSQRLKKESSKRSCDNSQAAVHASLAPLWPPSWQNSNSNNSNNSSRNNNSNNSSRNNDNKHHHQQNLARYLQAQIMPADGVIPPLALPEVAIPIWKMFRDHQLLVEETLEDLKVLLMAHPIGKMVSDEEDNVGFPSSGKNDNRHQRSVRFDIMSEDDDSEWQEECDRLQRSEVMLQREMKRIDQKVASRRRRYHLHHHHHQLDGHSTKRETVPNVSLEEPHRHRPKFSSVRESRQPTTNSHRRSTSRRVSSAQHSIRTKHMQGHSTTLRLGGNHSSTVVPQPEESTSLPFKRTGRRLKTTMTFVGPVSVRQQETVHATAPQTQTQAQSGRIVSSRASTTNPSPSQPKSILKPSNTTRSHFATASVLSSAAEFTPNYRQHQHDRQQQQLRQQLLQSSSQHTTPPNTLLKRRMNLRPFTVNVTAPSEGLPGSMERSFSIDGCSGVDRSSTISSNCNNSRRVHIMSRGRQGCNKPFPAAKPSLGVVLSR